MTGPTSGFPDWQQPANSNSILAQGTINVPGNTTATLFNGPASNYRSFLIYCEPTAGQGLLTFFPAGTTSFLTQAANGTVTLSTGVSVSVLVPVSGETATVRFVNDNVAAATVQFVVVGTTAEVTSPVYLSSLALLNTTGQVVPAGGNATFNSTTVMSGKAWLHMGIFPFGATMSELQITARFDTGSENYVIFQESNITGSLDQLIYLPPTPIQAQFFNNSGGAYTLDLSLFPYGVP